jgi:hypothetical protein
MPVKAGYLLLGAGGGVLVWSGLKNKSVSSVFRQLAGGDSPSGATSAGLDVSGVTPPTGTAVSGTTATSMTGISPGSIAAPANITNASQAQQYAFSLFPKYGWGADQEQPLVNLWNQESGWNANAVNPSSGAAGIPQALGHGNVFGLGWANAAAQIIWGLDYIMSTYGTPAAAWAHEQANDWY